ncbi:hypothetical protein GCM10009544_07810 [Streptomyces stramineus]|uniref:Uncharacterized protein n=1 Tax=Streptomyces stramineus TaxID=173861 RepID=A0ABP3JCC3_9ACTN
MTKDDRLRMGMAVYDPEREMPAVVNSLDGHKVWLSPRRPSMGGGPGPAPARGRARAAATAGLGPASRAAVPGGGRYPGQPDTRPRNPVAVP